MKGFLHRMAAGVVQPRTTLHPFVQSIFAPSAESSAVGLDTLHESISAARPVTQSQAPHREVATTAQSLVQRPADSREHFESVLPTQREPSSSTNLSLGSHDKSEDRSAIRGESTQIKSRKTQDIASAEDDLNSSSPVAGFIPLIVGTDAGAARGEQLVQPVSQSAAYADSAKAELARINNRWQAAQPAPVAHSIPSQPDDIQIHIGRIEVIAVPQATQRAAAPVPRKGLSLDEYLGRRNGRSR